jgi:hypothetical protein
MKSTFVCACGEIELGICKSGGYDFPHTYDGPRKSFPYLKRPSVGTEFDMAAAERTEVHRLIADCEPLDYRILFGVAFILFRASGDFSRMRLTYTKPILIFVCPVVCNGPFPLYNDRDLT